MFYNLYSTHDKESPREEKVNNIEELDIKIPLQFNIENIRATTEYRHLMYRTHQVWVALLLQFPG